jgi:hypothetical protein
MEFWTDVKDWLGGYPMEFAGLQETREFCRQELGLDLVNLKTGEGCTEYVFCRLAENAHWRGIAEGRQLTPLTGPFSPQGGNSYTASLPAMEGEANDSENQRRSQLMLYEDGKLLGLAHALHSHIARYGKGRFNHWGSSLLFSASDNSDPNANGRRYAYCERF